MDMTESIAPRSDQMNSDDLISGPRTFTITDVRRGNAEQPVDIHLAEFPRPWKPSKSMRRVLVFAWGSESAAYVGKRVTLFRDPSITFGRDTVGGVRVSHMSGLDRPLKLALTVKRGQKAQFVVEPLPDNAPTSAPVSEVDLLKAEWKTATPERRAEIEAEVAALKAGAE